MVNNAWQALTCCPWQQTQAACVNPQVTQLTSCFEYLREGQIARDAVIRCWATTDSVTLGHFAVTRVGVATQCAFLPISFLSSPRRWAKAHSFSFRQAGSLIRCRGGSATVFPNWKAEFPERAMSHLSTTGKGSMAVLRAAPLPGLSRSPGAVSGHAGKRGTQDLSEVLWFQAVPYVFLEEEEFWQAVAVFFCLVSFYICI